MYHAVGRIVAKMTDYKICKECGSCNWYENEECFNCSSNKFKPIGKRKQKQLEEFYEEYYKDFDNLVEV